jgi:protein-tyrosine phosphatase
MTDQTLENTRSAPGTRRVAVLFVCTGNICRSPTAEGVFRHLIEQQGLTGQVHVASAGTHDYHVGNMPDRRSVAAAQRRGYDLSALKARQITPQDCERYDYILAMDSDNYRILGVLCKNGSVKRLLDFVPDAVDKDVPDPYYGGDAGFERVLDLIEHAAQGLLDEIKREHLQKT